MVSIGLQRYLFFILHSSFSILHFQIPFRFLAHGSPEGHLLQFAAYRRVVEQEEQHEPVQFAHKSKELLVKM